MCAPVLSFSSRMISYPCFPPLLRRERTNKSRKLFTIRSLTALVIVSRELSRFDIIGFQYNPLLRGYRRLAFPGLVETREGLSGATVHRMPHHLSKGRDSSEMPKV